MILRFGRGYRGRLIVVPSRGVARNCAAARLFPNLLNEVNLQGIKGK